MRKFLIIFLFFFSSIECFSINEFTIKLNFNAFWNGSKFELNNRSLFSGKDSIEFESFKFYVSGIELYKGNKIVFSEQNRFHLIDFSDPSSLSIILKTEKEIHYDHISFNIGIDSITNISGAMGGDLDPTKGMYWAWQSGYINLKLEGKSSAYKTRGNDFFYHLGGYSFPNNALQNVKLDCKTKTVVNIDININTFFKDLNITETNQIMSPGNKAVMLSKKAVQMFSIRK